MQLERGDLFERYNKFRRDIFSNKKTKRITKLANDDIIRTMNSNIYSKNIDKLKIKSADFDYENYELILNFDKSKIDRISC